MAAAQYAYLRGGNGSGGPYDWNDMTLVPDCSTTLTQRQAIGALTYDAGVAVNMQYASSGSGAYMNYADTAMTSTFHYSNSIYGYNSNNTISTAALSTMLNPNLDWGNPVILGIYNSSNGDGHAIVADGYGYNSSTLYHHLNLGWSGTSDAWYNLPNIDAYYTYDVVDSTIYNIYMSGSGEIISGRATITGSGSPISGATVTATKSGGGTYSAATNSNGIYAIAKIPSNSSYTVSVVKTGYSFTSRSASTGKSKDNQPTSGNCWGIDFNGTQLQAPPVATDSNVSVSAGTSQVITLQATDDGLPNPPGALTYIITSLPKYGVLSDPCAAKSILCRIRLSITVMMSIIPRASAIRATSISISRQTTAALPRMAAILMSQRLVLTFNNPPPRLFTKRILIPGCRPAGQLYTAAQAAQRILGGQIIREIEQVFTGPAHL